MKLRACCSSGDGAAMSNRNKYRQTARGIRSKQKPKDTTLSIYVLKSWAIYCSIVMLRKASRRGTSVACDASVRPPSIRGSMLRRHC